MTDEAFWIAVGSVAQVVLAIGVPLSILVYRWSERTERDKFKNEERDKFYAQLDATYMSILKMVVDNPRLGRPDSRGSADEEIQYDAFAFIMWNFIESIYDFCLSDPSLKETWHCILVHESLAHAGWFNRAENRRKFKHKFCHYIDREVFAPRAQAQPA